MSRKLVTLKQGSRGQRVKKVQHYLGILEDGIFGPKTTQAVKDFQKQNKLEVTGEVDYVTYEALEASREYSTGLSKKSLQLILDYEVGGGEKYYNKKLIHPTWPGHKSGITIGVGYDLGYNTLDPWLDFLSLPAVSKLSEAVGVTGLKASRLVSKLSTIAIPWSSALHVFETHTIPEQLEKTFKTFPGMENLHPDIQGALVSVVFNRGTAMKGDSRREMRAIKRCVEEKNVEGIAEAIEEMKRLWVGKGLEGLLARRDAEAALVRSTIKKTKED